MYIYNKEYIYIIKNIYIYIYSHHIAGRLELQNQWAAHQPAELRSKGKETQEQDCHEAGPGAQG